MFLFVFHQMIFWPALVRLEKCGYNKRPWPNKKQPENWPFHRYTRARSSMEEQWPFKPLVLGSNPSALTNLSSFGRIFGSGSPQGGCYSRPSTLTSILLRENF